MLVPQIASEDMRMQCEHLKRTLVSEWIEGRFLANAKNIETNGHQMFMVQNETSIKNERWLLHGTEDQFIIQFLNGNRVKERCSSVRQENDKPQIHPIPCKRR